MTTLTDPDRDLLTRQDDAHEPLTSAEAFRVSRIAGRLKSQLARLWSALPPEQRGGSALSRLLHLDRSSCQRISAALQTETTGADTLLALPGPEACEAFIEACRQWGLPDADTSTAMAACHEYRELVREVGRSKAGLTRRLQASRHGSPANVAARGPLSPIEHAKARERHFAASAEIAGRWSDLHAYVWCYRPDPGDPTRVQSISGTMLSGHESRVQAVPLVLTAGFEKGFDGGDRLFSPLSPGLIDPAASHILLPDFCSSPMPSISAHHRGESVDYILGTDQTALGRPTDIALAHRATLSMSHPAAEHPPILEVWYMSMYPARHLVMDVYLHRDLARACLPSASTHGHSTHLVTLEDRGSTELPHRPPLRILSRGPADADSIHAPRQSEFVRALLSEAKWRDDDLIGYRCEIDYPVWRVGHVIVFRFETQAPR